MRQFSILFVIIFTSCSNEKLETFELAKSEVIETTTLDPIGIKFKYPRTYMEDLQVTAKEERLFYVYLRKADNPFQLFTILPLSPSRNGRPKNDFFKFSFDGIKKNYPNAQINW